MYSDKLQYYPNAGPRQHSLVWSATTTCSTTTKPLPLQHNYSTVTLQLGVPLLHVVPLPNRCRCSTITALLHCSYTTITKLLQINYQKCLVELEVARELPQELVDTVQPLQEHRTLLTRVTAQVAAPISELVPK